MAKTKSMPIAALGAVFLAFGAFLLSDKAAQGANPPENLQAACNAVRRTCGYTAAGFAPKTFPLRAPSSRERGRRPGGSEFLEVI